MSVPGSRWYGCDPRNCMVCTCWFVVMAAIAGAWLWDYMQKNLPLSIIAYAGKRYMLWTWGKIRLRNCQWRSGMIWSRGCFVWNWSLQNGESFRMTWRIRATGTEVSSGRRVTLLWTKLALGEYEVTEPSGCVDTWCHFVRVNFWPPQQGWNWGYVWSLFWRAWSYGWCWRR